VATLVVLGMAGVLLVWDFLAHPEHVVRYPPREAMHRRTDSM
jgi:hypothetical protein